MFDWFRKKPSWERVYAERLYDGLVVGDNLGEMTPAKLRIPIAAYQRYKNKALLHREMMCFTALIAAANPKTAPELPPVMLAFGRLLEEKLPLRGLHINVDELADAAPSEVEQMTADPFQWAQRWLAEFRDNPNDNYMVALFADHSLKQFQAFKHAIETTRQK